MLNICQSVALVIKKNYKKSFKLLFIKSKKNFMSKSQKKSKNFKNESDRGKKNKERRQTPPPPPNLLNYVSKKKNKFTVEGIQDCK